VYPLRLDDPARRFYVSAGNPYLAAIGDRGYFVVLHGAPALYELRPESSKPRRLALPRRTLGRRPEIDAWKGCADSHGSRERTRNFVAGLYADGKGLYILKRAGAGWSLTAINAQMGKATALWRLPGVALDHLTIIPGPQEWAFLEAGSMMNPVPPTSSPLILLPIPPMRLPTRAPHGELIPTAQTSAATDPVGGLIRYPGWNPTEALFARGPFS
jgi:hypothetical protein